MELVEGPTLADRIVRGPVPGAEAVSIARQTGPAFVGLSFLAPNGDPQSAKALKAPNISTGFFNGIAAWSPDGRRLAVASQNSNEATSIWLTDPDAADPFRKLVELPIGPRIRGMTWTSDGSLIVGQYDATSDIVLMDQGATTAPIQ